MGCSLGKQAKKEAEEENLVDKPVEKNEENVLFERPAASGENAQEPLLQGVSVEVSKEGTADIQIDKTELDILKNVTDVGEAVSAEAAKVEAAVEEKKDEVASATAEAASTVSDVTKEVKSTLEKKEEDFVMVDKKDVAEDIKATAMEVASEVVKSVTEECKTMVTKEVSKITSSASEQVSKVVSGTNESVKTLSNNVSESVTKHTTSATESVSKITSSSTQEYKTVVSSVSKFSDSVGSAIDSVPAKEDVVTEVQHFTKESSKVIKSEPIITTVSETVTEVKKVESDSKDAGIVSFATEKVKEGVTKVADKVEEVVVPVVEEKVSTVISAVSEKMPSSLIDKFLPTSKESESSTVLTSNVDSSDVKELVEDKVSKEEPVDIPAVPLDIDVAETSVDSGKIVEPDATETSVDALVMPKVELQETSVDSGNIVEAITETSVDTVVDTVKQEIEEAAHQVEDSLPPPPPPVVEDEEKTEEIFKSEHTESNNILSTDLMTAEVPSALPSPKGAYEEDLILPTEEAASAVKSVVEEVQSTESPVLVDIEEKTAIVEEPVKKPYEESLVEAVLEEVQQEFEQKQHEAVEQQKIAVEESQVAEAGEAVVEELKEAVIEEPHESVAEEHLEPQETVEEIPSEEETKQPAVEESAQSVHTEEGAALTPSEAKTNEDNSSDVVEEKASADEAEQVKEAAETIATELTPAGEITSEAVSEQDIDNAPGKGDSHTEEVTAENEVANTENDKSTENGPSSAEQIDISGSVEQVPVADDDKESIVVKDNSEISQQPTVAMEELPVQKSTIPTENSSSVSADMDNESNVISHSQDVQSLPNGENQVQTEEETGHDPVTTSAALTDRQYNTDLYIPQVASDTAAKLPTPPAEPVPATESEQLEELFPHEEALEDAATKIQANYKGYKARKEIKELKMKTNAATKIQAGIRGHLTRKKIKTMKDEMSQQGHHHHHHHHHHPHKHMHQQHNPRQQNVHHKRMNPESPQTQDENVLLHDPNVHHAATKIQAQFRGFRARQQMKVMKVKANAEKTLPPVDPEDPRAHEAATKIQAMIRGRKARKEMKVLKLQNRHGHNRHRGHGGSHGKPSKSHHKDTSREHTLETEQGEADQAETQDTSPVSPNVTQVSNEESSKEQEIDIDLNDPEVEAAALKIQSGFRGYKKKKTEEMKNIQLRLTLKKRLM
ncbi:golgin subfamily B member 1 isoform X3 [Octopus sinensis]|uniref:Golgin subfamily B member 1 isoform X3 n=1 Tax=Octopus sinensis TaxID=2607531 RepID=A0A6P7TBR4_9MOLL|nr:golgin subfamily B member 1 isoform X3 [Octopus sinensis]